MRCDRFWTQAATTFTCGTYGTDFIIFEKPVQKAFQKNVYFYLLLTYSFE